MIKIKHHVRKKYSATIEAMYNESWVVHIWLCILV